MNYYISIQDKDDKYYSCLQITFTSDGGFFIMPINLGNDGYFIHKMITPGRGFGTKKIKVDHKTEWKTYRKPKLMHHLDGTVQISGTGVTSGFYKTSKRPKGVYSDSMNLLLNNNDGGPIFAFGIWGINHLKPKILKEKKETISLLVKKTRLLILILLKKVNQAIQLRVFI